LKIISNSRNRSINSKVSLANNSNHEKTYSSPLFFINLFLLIGPGIFDFPSPRETIKVTPNSPTATLVLGISRQKLSMYDPYGGHLFDGSEENLT